MQEQLRRGVMRIHIQVIDTRRVERRSPPDQTVNLVPLRQKKLRKIGAILSRNTGDQCPLRQTEPNRLRGWEYGRRCCRHPPAYLATQPCNVTPSGDRRYKNGRGPCREGEGQD